MNKKHFEKWLVNQFHGLGIASIMTVLEKKVYPNKNDNLYVNDKMYKLWYDTMKKQAFQKKEEMINTLYMCSTTDRALWSDSMTHTASTVKNMVLDYLNSPISLK